MTKNERISLPIWKKILSFIISLLFFLFQVLLYAALISLSFFNVTEAYLTMSITAIAIFALSMIIGICFVMHIVHTSTQASYKIIWSILILIVPIPSIVLYLMNKSSRLASKKKRSIVEKEFSSIKECDNIKKLEEEDFEGASLVNVVQANTFAPVYSNVKYTFFSKIEDKFEDLLNETKKAQKFIFMEYFIISDGELMNRLLPILEERGSAGVEIKILYDTVGSVLSSKKETFKRLTSIPNCKIDNYEPLGPNINLLFNYRDHRKIYVIDGKIAYCGGDNLADEYINKKVKYGYWRDNCGKYEGEVVKTFTILFLENWFISTKEKKIVDFPEYNIIAPGYVMAFGDGPMEDTNQTYDLFLSMINSAKKYLFISTPYFIINDGIIDAIALKAKSGVDVQILMPKIPDKKPCFYMGRGHYREILKAGGKIYEFTPGFNHAKNIIIDDKYAFEGTVNIDYRSMFLHHECGALIMHNPEIIKMRDDFKSAIKQSELITYEKWKKRPARERFIAYFLNLFAPMF